MGRESRCVKCEIETERKMDVQHEDCISLYYSVACVPRLYLGS